MIVIEPRSLLPVVPQLIISRNVHTTSFNAPASKRWANLGPTMAPKTTARGGWSTTSHRIGRQCHRPGTRRRPVQLNIGHDPWERGMDRMVADEGDIVKQMRHYCLALPIIYMLVDLLDRSKKSWTAFVVDQTMCRDICPDPTCSDGLRHWSK